MTDVVAIAERLADDLLFLRALETDRSDTVPVDLLDALAEAGLYGLTAPTAAGGLEADFATVCAVIEALASGCRTTTFIWAQHLGTVIAAAASDNPALADWLAPFARGDRRAGLGGALPGPADLTARPVDGGWIFKGISPFVSGWGRIDVIHTAARTADGQLVWALVDARDSDQLRTNRLELAALNATATVRAYFADTLVPATRVTSVVPYEEALPAPQLLRIHASFALGVAARCCRLLERQPFSGQLEQVRRELDQLEPTSIEAARAAAGELALRAAAAVAVERGSRSLLFVEHGQRLLREALFCAVYALRPGARAALLGQLERRQHHSGASSNVVQPGDQVTSERRDG